MSNFRVVVLDFEYEIRDGDPPNPLCMVAYVLDDQLRHVRTIKLWRGEFDKYPPFDDFNNTLFVGYSLWAELICFIALGWRFPKHVYDLHTAYQFVTNVLDPYEPEAERKKLRRRLSDACRAYDIAGWENIDKEDISEAIGNGTWRDKGYTPQDVLNYCEEDVRNSAALLRKQARGHGQFKPVNTAQIRYWSNYSAKCIALIQAKGMPIDMPMWNVVQENLATVIARLLERFDPSHNDDDPIYNTDGKWSRNRFAAWLLRQNIHEWPHLASGMLDLDSDAFRLMQHAHPGILNILMLRDSLGFISKARLTIGADGRSRAKLFPFGTATGRNAHRGSVYNASAGMRSFMICPPGKILAYLDWRSQEMGIAAVLSGDQALQADYRAGDIYHALARMCGLTTEPDPLLWKKLHRDQRDRMKPLALAINYGMSVASLAKGIEQHQLIAAEIFQRHRRRYPRFWSWRQETLDAAMVNCRIEAEDGWP